MDVGSSLRLESSAAPAAKRLGLQEGEILSIRIGKYLGHDRYAVTVRGSVLTIRSSVPLQPGRIVDVRVLFTPHVVELRLLSTAESTGPPGARAVPPAFEGPSPGRAGVLNPLIQSMQRSGLAVTAESMAAITAMVPQSRRGESGYLRFATILFDKHLHVEPELLEELYLAVSGGPREQPGDQRRGRGGEAGRGGDREGGDIGRGADEVSADFGGRPAEESQGFREELRALLRGKSGEEAGRWALFNHSRGEHESWVVVPFGLERNGVRLAGSIRLLISPRSLQPRSPVARLSVSRAAVAVTGVGAFEIEGSPPRRLSFHGDPAGTRGEVARLLPILIEKLRNLDVEVDDTISGGKNFDGFSSETVPNGGVDARA